MFRRHCRDLEEGPGRRFARDALGFRGHHFGRGHRHMRGGRLGRMFDQGDLRFVILRLIAEKPRHGYELIKAIEEKLGGLYSPSPGVVYPTLTLLEELGYATVQDSAGNKKLYAITAEGTAFLEANKATVEAIFGRMDQVSEAQGGGPAPQIQRAVENLRTALRLRLAHGPLDEGQVRAVAAALDAAALEIEKS
jgi:DNA-binding PadR family transcriptional regulator